MGINQMRLALIYVVSESEKFSKQSKVQLARFIEQADEHQLKLLLMDGEITSKDKLDEQTREVINDRYISEAIGWMIVFLAGMALGRRKYKKLLKQGQAHCQRIPRARRKMSTEYQRCMADGAAKAFDARIDALRHSMVRCSDTPKPDKCKTRFMQAIRKLEKRKQKLVTKHTLKIAKV